jgi:cytochrome c-type biogenesis protein
MGAPALASGVGATFADTVLNGPLALGAAVAVIAGLVSFLSPCVLPLVPGYLSYVTGFTGAQEAERDRRWRTFAGAVLFVAGFSVVFVSYGAAFGGLGRALGQHQTVIERVLGGITIVLGLVFLGLVPGLQRELRVHRLPSAGLIGAPLLGMLFGFGWIPCVGPTLGAVQTLALSSASAGRGAFLSIAYCAGLGVPFVLAAFGFRWLLRAFGAARQHAQWVTRFGGLLLVVLGVLVVGGWWDDIMRYFQSYVGSHTGLGTSV